MYTPNELRVLWHLKRHGPLSVAPFKRPGLITLVGEALNMKPGTIRAVLRTLEQKNTVIRTYMKGTANKFGEGAGNPMIRLELVDPTMSLPPCPKPPSTIVVEARENEELFEMTRVEPDHDAVILALLARNEELQEQVDKLANVIIQQQEQIRLLQHDRDRKIPEHLTSRVKDALTPEQWESLTHSSRR